MSNLILIFQGALWTTLTAAEVGLNQYLEDNINRFVERLEDNSPEAQGMKNKMSIINILWK